MNNTTLNYGNGIRRTFLYQEELVFLDGCVLYTKERTLFEEDKEAKPSKLLGKQYKNPMHLDDLGIDEIGDLKLEIEEKYPEKYISILAELNIKP